jgi:hypothetical protein
VFDETTKISDFAIAQIAGAVPTAAAATTAAGATAPAVAVAAAPAAPAAHRTLTGSSGAKLAPLQCDDVLSLMGDLDDCDYDDDDLSIFDALDVRLVLCCGRSTDGCAARSVTSLQAVLFNGDGVAACVACSPASR